MIDDNFDKMAEVYDDMIDWDARLQRELPFIVEELQGAERIIEFACSTGRHTLALAEWFAVTGVDINQKMIERAKEVTKPKSDKIELIHSNLLDIEPDKLGTFDGGIILANSLVNLETEENIIKALKLMRKLITAGKLIGQTVCLDNSIPTFLYDRQKLESDSIWCKGL